MIESKKGKLKEMCLYKSIDRDTGSVSHYLRLVYEYKDDNGNLHEVIIPKVSLSFFESHIPTIEESNSGWFGTMSGSITVGSLRLETVNVPVANYEGKESTVENTYYVDVIKKRAVKKMTLEEIEKKLGCKIEIVSKEE